MPRAFLRRRQPRSSEWRLGKAEGATAGRQDREHKENRKGIYRCGVLVGQLRAERMLVVLALLQRAVQGS